MGEEKEAGAVEGNERRERGRREESAKNFAPNFVFQMNINTTQDRIGVNWTRVCKILLCSDIRGKFTGTHT